jgi:hypothetical protein
VNDFEKALAAFEPRPLEQLFEELTQAARQWKRGEAVHRPLVTLHLQSGRDVTGAVLDLFEPRVGGRTLLVSRRVPGRGPDTEVLLVPLAHVEAVTLHELPKASGAAATTEPPSPLQLKRKARALVDQHSALLGAPLAVDVGEAADDAALAALGQALEALGTVLAGICGDALGRESLKAGVTKFVVVTGASSQVTKQGGEVRVTTAVAADQRLSVDVLKAKLEALL